MTTSQIIACAISWTAAIVAITALVLVRRARRESATHYRVEYPDGRGMLTTRKPLTEAEFKALETQWRRRYGRALDEEEEPGA